MKTASIHNKDFRWALVWLAGTALLGLWDVLFLNKPALRLVCAGFINTMIISLLVVIFTLVLAWAATLALHFLEMKKHRTGYMMFTFGLNLIRSIPQIIGILFGYIAVSTLVQNNVIHGTPVIFTLLALTISVFVFLEFVDLMRERIAHYIKLDFYNALRVCGVPEMRIVNFNILWKNSRVHILNKLIAVFGATVFLQCSVDFIISVGLSTDVNTFTLPPTLGGLLATIDSKQDILAIGYALTHPAYLGNLFLGNLQGVSVAFALVFTLVCMYQIANGYAQRHRL